MDSLDQKTACDETWVSQRPQGIAAAGGPAGAGAWQGSTPPLAPTFAAPQPVACSIGGDQALPVAKQAISTLRALGKADPISLNFLNEQQVGRATLDEVTPPLEVEYLHVGATQTTGSVPNLFEYFYQADNKQLGLLRVMKHADSKWRAVKFFEDKWARQLATASASFARQHLKPKLVVVPELNLRFLRIESPQGVRFVTVRPGFGLNAMVPYTAKKLWERVATQPGFKQLKIHE
jgi:hypothetical protein